MEKNYTGFTLEDLKYTSGDVEVAVSGWRLMFGQIRAQVHNFDHEDFSEDSTQHSIEDFAEGFSEDSTADSSEDQ
jgi:hypothetical protein